MPSPRRQRRSCGCNRSNFQVTGFTARPELGELAALARERNVLLLDDLGSGCLVETTDYHVEHEPTVQESLDGGADLTLFSGDKLLGGPQCGLIVGSEELVGTLRRHPLARALRVDKLTIAALNATLMAYVAGTEREEIPVWRMLALEQEQLEPRARAWAEAAGEGGRVVESRTMIGGGAAPGAGRTTWCAAPTGGAGRGVAGTGVTGSRPAGRGACGGGRNAARPANGGEARRLRSRRHNQGAAAVERVGCLTVVTRDR